MATNPEALPIDPIGESLREEIELAQPKIDVEAPAKRNRAAFAPLGQLPPVTSQGAGSAGIGDRQRVKALDPGRFPCPEYRHGMIGSGPQPNDSGALRAGTPAESNQAPVRSMSQEQQIGVAIEIERESSASRSPLILRFDSSAI